MKIGDLVDGTGYGAGGAGLVVAAWRGGVAGVARLEHGGYYWRLTTEPADAGCGGTSFTLLAEGWAQKWGAALGALHGVARHLEITLVGPERAALDVETSTPRRPEGTTI